MNHKPKYNFLHRIYLSITGIFIALKRERHMKIHLLIALVLILPTLFLPIPIIQIMGLIMLIGLLFIIELINTSIELTVDLITKRFSYRAKLAKDIASGAVLISALLLIIFAIFIYYPYVYNLIIGETLGI